MIMACAIWLVGDRRLGCGKCRVAERVAHVSRCVRGPAGPSRLGAGVSGNVYSRLATLVLPLVSYLCSIKDGPTAAYDRLLLLILVEI